MTITFLHILRFAILVASQFVKLPFLILHFLWEKNIAKSSEHLTGAHGMCKNWMKKNPNGFG
jgi:hypothetical protein